MKNKAHHSYQFSLSFQRDIQTSSGSIFFNFKIIVLSYSKIASVEMLISPLA